MSGVEGERPLDKLVLLTEFPMSAVLGIDANGIVYGVYSSKHPTEQEQLLKTIQERVSMKTVTSCVK